MTVREIRVFGDRCCVRRPIQCGLLRTPAGTRRGLVRHAGRARSVGLAAPQIGVSLRVFVYDVDGDRGHFVNPTVVSASGEQLDEEGCLSVPGSSTRRRVRPT
jgi:peptide deformylase